MSQEAIEDNSNSDCVIDTNDSDNSNSDKANDNKHKRKKPSLGALILSYILVSVYWLFLIFLAVQTFVLKDPSAVFNTGLIALSLFSILVGWYIGFWSRLKSIIRYSVLIGTSLLLMANGFSIIAQPVQGIIIGLGTLVGIQILLSFLPIPKLSTGLIDSFLGIVFQLTQTVLLVALIAFLSTFRTNGPSVMPKIAETVPAKIVEHFSPKLNQTLKKALISPENHHLINSPSDTNGLMLALSIERGLLEPMHNDVAEETGSTGNAEKQLVFPFRGNNYRIKDPTLIKAIQQKMKELSKQRAR